MPRGLSDAQRASGLVEMQEIALSQGGACLATAYVNAQTPMPWRCAKGHEWTAKPHAVRHYSWCPTCAFLNRGRRPD